MQRVRLFLSPQCLSAVNIKVRSQETGTEEALLRWGIHTRNLNCKGARSTIESSTNTMQLSRPAQRHKVRCPSPDMPLNPLPVSWYQNYKWAQPTVALHPCHQAPLPTGWDDRSACHAMVSKQKAILVLVHGKITGCCITTQQHTCNLSLPYKDIRIKVKTEWRCY